MKYHTLHKGTGDQYTIMNISISMVQFHKRRLPIYWKQSIIHSSTGCYIILASNFSISLFWYSFNFLVFPESTVPLSTFVAWCLRARLLTVRFSGAARREMGSVVLDRGYSYWAKATSVPLALLPIWYDRLPENSVLIYYRFFLLAKIKHIIIYLNKPKFILNLNSVWW